MGNSLRGVFCFVCVFMCLKPLVMQECSMGGVEFNELFHKNANVN